MSSQTYTSSAHWSATIWAGGCGITCWSKLAKYSDDHIRLRWALTKINHIKSNCLRLLFWSIEQRFLPDIVKWPLWLSLGTDCECIFLQLSGTLWNMSFFTFVQSFASRGDDRVTNSFDHCWAVSCDDDWVLVVGKLRINRCILNESGACVFADICCRYSCVN
jgi:hypothetical protein